MAYQFPLEGGRINASISGNTATAGVNSLISTGTMVLSGGNNVTLSQTGNTIGISAANAPSGVAIAGGGATVTSGTGNFIGSGAISVNSTTGQSFIISSPNTSSLAGAGAISIGTNGNTVSIGAPVQSNLSATGAVSIATNGNTISIGAPAQTAYSFANSNNVTFGTNGSTVTASVAAASGGVALSAGGSSFGSGTVNLNASGALTLAGSSDGYNFSVPNTSSLAATGIVTIASAGNTISVGAPAFSAGIATNSTVTNQVIFSAGNNITLGQSTGAGGATIGITGASGGGGGGGVAIAGGGTTFTTGTANFSASTPLGLSANSNGYTFTAPATSSLAGAGAITVGTNGNTISVAAPVQSNLMATGGASISTNGNTIYIGAPAGGGFTASHFNPQDGIEQVAGQQGNGTLHLQPMIAPNVTFNRLVFPVIFSGNAASTGSATMSMFAGIYTQNNSTLSLLTSFSTSQSIGHSGTVNSATNNGLKLFTMGATASISSGAYWIGIISRTTSSSQSMSISQVLGSQMSSNIAGLWGQVSNASHQYIRGLGIYSATTSGIPSSIAFSQLRGTGSLAQQRPMFYFINGTA